MKPQSDWWEYSEVDADSGMTVHIAKVGGGTIGKYYDGEWEFEVLNSRGHVIQKSYMTTGTLKNHLQACHIVLDSYSKEI